jgi:manganese transport protein
MVMNRTSENWESPQPPPEPRAASADSAELSPVVEAGWRRRGSTPSLPEVFASVRVPHAGGFWKKLWAFSGPGLMVAVGYMDPGNWATDLEGGAKFGYTLLSVVLLSNFMAILLQHLSLKLGIVTGRDLAQACRDHYSPPVSFCLWLLCEVAIAACDLAEIIGSAIALNLLTSSRGVDGELHGGLPLVVGVLLTSLDVIVVLLLQHKGFRYLESLVAGLIFIIGGSFAYQILVSQPPVMEMLGGLLPSPQIIRNTDMLYIAIGILGATVMPHNLYLHSSIVQTRAFTRDDHGKAMAIRFGTIDSTVALLSAFFINAAILVVSARAFHGTPHENVADIGDAYKLLSPVLGAPLASVFFALALLASGQNSTLTGTMAGQIVMEGFLELRLRPWVRRMITRLVAIVPAAIVASLYGEGGVSKLLVLSQVILSLQLSFAVIPLVQFTGEKAKMGRFVNTRWLQTLSWIVTVIIVVLNGYLLVRTIAGAD